MEPGGCRSARGLKSNSQPQGAQATTDEARLLFLNCTDVTSNHSPLA